MAIIDFEGLVLRLQELYANRIQANELRVRNTLDVSGADVVGYLGVRGDYGSPALEAQPTLTTGADPAAQVSWGDFPASAAAGVEIVDPSGTIDPATDIQHWPIQDPNNPRQKMFSFHWVDDPGNDVELEVTVAKII